MAAPNHASRKKFLDDLSKRVEKTPAIHMTPTTIEPIFPFLDSAKIPTLSSRPSQADHQLVELAISALLVLVACGPVHLAISPALVARILAPDGWPHIWKWIQFLHSECISEESRFDKEQNERASIAIIMTLWPLSQITLSRKAVINTPGTFQLVTVLFLQTRPPELDYLTTGATLALNALLDPDDLADPGVPQVLDGAGGNATLVATTVLAGLRAAVETASVLGQIELHLNLIRNLSCVSCRPLHLAFLNQGAIPEILKIMLNARPAGAISTQKASLCFSIIHKGFYAGNGAVWAVQALDSGLLIAILQSAAWITIVDHSELVELLTDLLDRVLSKYLLFRSVLCAVRKSIRQVKKKGLGTKVSTGVLWGAWNKFLSLAEERLSLMDVWDKEGGRTWLQRCSRTQCSKKYEDDKLKRCSGCLSPLYCSRECQRLAWPEHKRGCKEHRRMLQEGSRVPQNTLDTSFIGWISHLKVYRHLPDIVKDAVEFGVPISTFVLEVNYAVIPNTFNVTRVSDHSFLPDASGGERDWEGVLRRCEASNGKHMAMKISVPLDEVSAEGLISALDVGISLSRTANLLQTQWFRETKIV